jgi:hypothetical protein
MSEGNVGAEATGEITAVGHLSRSTAGTDPNVGIGALSSEIAYFFKEFNRKTHNPHPEQHFWNFNGPLVPFGGFWVPNDCLLYLRWLSAEHGNFATNFKLSAGLGEPMLSLLGSVMAADKS